MTVAWPSTLPQKFDISQFEASTRDGRLQTPMEVGPPKLRRRNALAVMPVAGSFLVEFDDYARFLRFWEEDTVGGVLPFTIPDQILDGEPLTDEDGNVITDENGDPLLMSSTWLVQFAAPPTFSAPSNRWIKVSVSLNVMP